MKPDTSSIPLYMCSQVPGSQVIKMSLCCIRVHCIYVYLSVCVFSGARVAAHRNVTCRAGAGFANEHASGFNRAREREVERDRETESWSWICK